MSYTVSNKIYNFHFSAYFKLFARSEAKDHLFTLPSEALLSDGWALRGTINFLEFPFQIFTEFCLEVLAAKGLKIAHSCNYNSASLHLPNYFIQQSNLSINKLCLVKMA